VRLPRRRRGRSGRWAALLGLAAAGVGLVYLATRDVEPEGPALGAVPPPDTDDAAAERDAEAAAGAEREPGGRFVDGAGGRIFVRAAGESGPALLLVHGLGGSSAHWLPQLAALANECRVFAIDLRGHGRSAASPGADYEIAAHAADLLAVADSLGLNRFALAGHSFGGWVALEVAAAHPQRVTALALVDPGGDTSGEAPESVESALAAVREEPRREFERHYREFLDDAKPATARRVLADLAATRDEVLVAGITEAMRYPARARLAAYSGPVLCLAGSLNDAPGSLTRTVPGLAVEWLAPASHWLMLDRPEQTSGLLAELVHFST